MRKTAAVLLVASLMLSGLLSDPVTGFADSDTQESTLGGAVITVEVPSTHTLTIAAEEGVTITYGDTSIIGGVEDGESGSGGTSGTEDGESASGGTDTESGFFDVPRLEEFTLVVTVESGYAISGIYLNGEDVTAQLVGDTLALSGIHAASTLVIETAKVSSDIRGVLYDLPEQDYPDSSLLYKVAVEVSGLTEVPEALQGIESLNTVEKISEVLKSILIGQCSYPSANMVIYEVTLVVSADNGETWEVAEEAHFPEAGLTVILPYPEGTAKDTQDFAAAHMFTSDAFGKVPGDVEIPAVTKLDSGLQVTLTGLSPVAIAWADVETEAETTEGAEATESPETTEGTEVTESSEATESTEATASSEGTEVTEGTESTERKDTSEDTDTSEETDASEDMDASEDTDAADSSSDTTENSGAAAADSPGNSSGTSGSSGISAVIAAVQGAVTGDAGVLLPWLLLLIVACIIVTKIVCSGRKKNRI